MLRRGCDPRHALLIEFELALIFVVLVYGLDGVRAMFIVFNIISIFLIRLGLQGQSEVVPQSVRCILEFQSVLLVFRLVVDLNAWLHVVCPGQVGFRLRLGYVKHELHLPPIVELLQLGLLHQLDIVFAQTLWLQVRIPVPLFVLLGQLAEGVRYLLLIFFHLLTC